MLSRPADISVVLPTYQRAATVTAVVDQLLQEELPGLEVVVVDDGSTDGTWERLAERAGSDDRLVVLRQENSGKRNATRAGADHAHGRVLLFLDDDVMPEPGLVAGHLGAHTGRDDLVVVGYMPTTAPQRPRGADFATVLYAREYEGVWEKYLRDTRAVLRSLWAGNMSMTRSGYRQVLAESGESFPFRHEDRDLGLRAAEAGLVGIADPSLRAIHQHSRTPRQFARDSYQQGAGAAALAQRYPGLVPLELHRFTDGLGRLPAAVVRAARHRLARAVLRRGLLTGLEAATRLDDIRPALAFARLLRRIEQQQGALDVLNGRGSA